MGSRQCGNRLTSSIKVVLERCKFSLVRTIHERNSALHRVIIIVENLEKSGKFKLAEKSGETDMVREKSYKFIIVSK